MCKHLRRSRGIVALVLLCAPIAHGQNDAQPVTEVKAAFVYKFAKFVAWPDSVFEDEESPFRIGVLGEDTLERPLRQIVRGKTIDDRPVEIEYSRTPEDLKDCHVVYLDLANEKDLADAVESFGEDAILTISDASRFTYLGGVIRLYQDDKRLRFEINIDAGNRAQLRISSKLLELAKVVREQPETEEG